MSASITTSNGLLVVTQVFPQDPSDKIALPVQNVTSIIKTDKTTVFVQNVTSIVQTAQPSFQDKMSEMTVMFLGGNPQSLGITQITIGLLFMRFSVSALLCPELYVDAALFMGLIFVVSGSLAVATQNGTSPDVIIVIGVLAVHAVSVLAAVSGVAYLCYLLSIGITVEDLCDMYMVDKGMMVVWSVVRGVLLLLCVLEVYVSITVCVFSGKALRAKQDSPHVVGIKSGSTPLASSPSMAESDVPLLDETAEDVLSGPPPYEP